MTEDEYRLNHPGVLRIYDISLDQMRDATQRDLDQALAVQQAYGMLRSAVSETHKGLQDSLEQIRRSHEAKTNG
jgi:hypothetical protein